MALTDAELAALPTGTTNAQALARNAGDLDTILNGSGSVENRRGANLLTLNAALALIGYEIPVAFTSGLSITRASQTVTNAGLTYHANPAYLPFTTTGTFGAQWMLISNVTKQELADQSDTSPGASIVGYKGRTVEDVLDEKVYAGNYPTPQDCLDYAIPLGIDVEFCGGTWDLYESLIIPSHWNYDCRQVVIDCGGAVFKMHVDEPVFESSNWGSTLMSDTSNGIVLKNFSVESTLPRLTAPAVRIQDWHQNSAVIGVSSVINDQMLEVDNCFYCTFDRIVGMRGDPAVPMNVFSNSMNLNKFSHFVALGGSIGLRFAGPVTAGHFTNMSLETDADGVGIQFEATVYDGVFENSYSEVAVAIDYTAIKFNDYVDGFKIKNNYFNFQSNADAYVVDYFPSPRNNITIEDDNRFEGFASDANIVKTVEALYGTGITINKPKQHGTLDDTYIDTSMFGENISWQQQIVLGGNAIARVINRIVPGNYSGAYSTALTSQAMGFVNNSSGTTLTLNTKIAFSLAMRVSVSLHFVINAVDVFTFGELVPTGFNTFAYFAYSGAGVAPSLIINATFVGGFLQINGTAGVNGLGSSNPITAVTGELRVI